MKHFILLALLMLVFTLQPVLAQGGADLAITQTADKNKVKLGETITFTITITNLGPEVATNIVFGDSLPDPLNRVSFSCEGGTPLDEYSTLCWVDSLAPGQSAVAIVVATPISNLSKQERQTHNSAYIDRADTPDPILENNQVLLALRIIGRIR